MPTSFDNDVQLQHVERDVLLVLQGIFYTFEVEPRLAQCVYRCVRATFRAAPRMAAQRRRASALIVRTESNRERH